MDYGRSCFFFFLMIRRPPRSTLFPYTRSSDLASPNRRSRSSSCGGSCRRRIPSRRHNRRSEEHTSELQSPDHLVCRLLLEKKKTQRSRRVWYTGCLMIVILILA